MKFAWPLVLSFFCSLIHSLIYSSVYLLPYSCWIIGGSCLWICGQWLYAESISVMFMNNFYFADRFTVYAEEFVLPSIASPCPPGAEIPPFSASPAVRLQFKCTSIFFLSSFLSFNVFWLSFDYIFTIFFCFPGWVLTPVSPPRLPFFCKFFLLSDHMGLDGCFGCALPRFFFYFITKQ